MELRLGDAPEALYEMLWLMQSPVHLAPGLEYASEPQAATNKPGSTGICRAIFEHWPSEQLQGPIRPAAFRSPYLRDDQHQDGRDLFKRWYQDICSHKSRGCAAAIIS